MSASSYRESSPDLARAMGPVARELFGDPTEETPAKNEMRFRSRCSLAVDTKAGTFYDHELGEGGGVLDLVQREKHTDKEGALIWLADRGHIEKPKGKATIAATYDYTDANGELLFQVVRFEPKDFRQRRPDPANDGKWIWKMAGVQLVPYRLPEVLDALSAGEPIYICEGEKAVEAILGTGLVATCSPGGAGKWRAEYGQWFNGADVVILPDNDMPGRKHGASVAQALAGHARRIRVLALPGLPDKGDAVDWLQAGGTAEQLEALAANGTVYIVNGSKVAEPPSRNLAAYLSAEAWAVRQFPPPVRLLGDVVTKTSRVFLIGMTGLGKTLLGVAIAAAMATGTDFLGWRCDRPVKVLYVDGEMPGELIKARIIDAMRRLDRPDLAGNLFFYSADMAEQIAAAFPGLGEMQPLNTEAGQDFIVDLIERLGGVDLVIFDNVMSLIAGDQKEEVPWSETLPLIAGLTRKQIGQVWLDHTGHNTARQYGSSTKAWRFDAVGIMTELPEDQRNERETGFRLSFDAPGKARRRTPDNWQDFAPRVVRLTDEGWESETAAGAGKPVFGKVPPSREVFYDALLKAITLSTAGPGAATVAQWQDECARQSMLEPASTGLKEAERTRPWRRAKSDLIGARWISVDGEIVRDLKHQYG